MMWLNFTYVKSNYSTIRFTSDGEKFPASVHCYRDSEGAQTATCLAALVKEDLVPSEVGYLSIHRATIIVAKDQVIEDGQVEVKFGDLDLKTKVPAE